jgi:hypothetical protein
MEVMMGGSKLIGFIVLLLNLAGCSTYGSSFGCGDASGVKCMPMDKVDRLIASGEIEEYTKVPECKGFRCKRSKVVRERELPVLQRDVDDSEVEFPLNLTHKQQQ